jgi:hypothetical protein
LSLAIAERSADYAYVAIYTKPGCYWTAAANLHYIGPQLSENPFAQVRELHAQLQRLDELWDRKTNCTATSLRSFRSGNKRAVLATLDPVLADGLRERPAYPLPPPPQPSQSCLMTALQMAYLTGRRELAYINTELPPVHALTRRGAALRAMTIHLQGSARSYHMTEMTTLQKAPHAIAEEIVREWLVDYRVRLDPHVATQLVSRIESGIVSDRLAVTRGQKIWERLRALLIGSVNLVAIVSLIAIALLFSFALIGFIGLIIRA